MGEYPENRVRQEIPVSARAGLMQVFASATQASYETRELHGDVVHDTQVALHGAVRAVSQQTRGQVGR